MTHSSPRRRLLLAAASAPLVLTAKAQALAATPDGSPPDASHPSFDALERTAGGRLGVCALGVDSGRRVQHRADERFPFCSTFKTMLSAAVLAQSVAHQDLLQRRIAYGPDDLAHYSPVTERHVGTGMTIAELCAAALQYSDNMAANLLMKQLGGPSAVTAFARSIGDRAFRLDRWETMLNTALPGDLRDTTTPAAMAASLRALLLGDALPAAQRTQLVNWMRGSTTGDKRIRAGVPAGSQVADKTGTGAYGASNDVGVIWPPSRGPVVLAVYYVQSRENATPNDAVIAAATRAALAALD